MQGLFHCESAIEDRVRGLRASLDRNQRQYVIATRMMMLMMMLMMLMMMMILFVQLSLS